MSQEDLSKHSLDKNYEELTSFNQSDRFHHVGYQQSIDDEPRGVL